jgi:hypothetical protein
MEKNKLKEKETEIATEKSFLAFSKNAAEYFCYDHIHVLERVLVQSNDHLPTHMLVQMF